MAPRSKQRRSLLAAVLAAAAVALCSSTVSFLLPRELETAALPGRRVAVALGLAASCGSAAEAATADVPSSIAEGYKKICYLLDHWEEETTDSFTGKRSPDKVRAYLGLRSIEDPLFQLDKKLLEKKVLDKVNPDYMEDFEDAVTKWTSAVTGSNSDAWVSTVTFDQGSASAYLDRSKENVEKAKTTLMTLAKCLDVNLS
eukprot:TRINITY_DN76672_c0_g1_i1.p1 TRINITY_DN76672_c0_g1~~TRINITY_DN76672_c0_g1_i1.p1  ORF type:complete len:215 (+),score=57.30 TRINITY_DN76672_c0_g1_i1:48-647(+)